MDTIRSRRLLALPVGIGALLLAGFIVVPTPASAKTHEVSMTAVETDVVVEG